MKGKYYKPDYSESSTNDLVLSSYELERTAINKAL